MADKVVGVLGGMGPEATVAFYEKLISHTPAGSDQDHLRIVIESNPKIPDRTEALLRGGESPVAMMANGASALKRAGADFIVIPCATAHAFLEALQREAELPILSMLDVSADGIREQHPQMRKVGLLATTGTVRARLFHDRLATIGIDVVTPDDPNQGRVLAAIRDIKALAPARTRAQIGADLREVAEDLVGLGAQGIILGCTELPLVISARDISVPTIDPTVLLARAAIRLAGREPKRLDS